MNAEQKELFRLAVLRVFDANRSRFGLGGEAVRHLAGLFGFVYPDQKPPSKPSNTWRASSSWRSFAKRIAPKTASGASRPPASRFWTNKGYDEKNAPKTTPPERSRTAPRGDRAPTAWGKRAGIMTGGSPRLLGGRAPSLSGNAKMVKQLVEDLRRNQAGLDPRGGGGGGCRRYSPGWPSSQATRRSGRWSGGWNSRRKNWTWRKEIPAGIQGPD